MIKKAYSFSEIGLKDNQEDRVFPNPSSVKPGQKYFILCDGMGGHENGEVASSTVSSAFGEYFEANPCSIADESYFKDALEYAYRKLDAKDTGAEKKMGTTLTCVLFNESGYLAAHIGDSRIYHVRDGKILYRSEDHSLVNDLLKAGEITEEEAKNYPRKNVITRAMQPNTRRCKATIHVSDDILPGDYIFMCCDGVLERISDEKLCEILSSKLSDEKKIATIKAECDKGTRDNYTCWLIPIEGKSKNAKANSLSGMKFPGSIVLASLVVGIIIGATLDHKLFNKKATVTKDQIEIQPLNQKIDSLQHKIDSLQHMNDSIVGINNKNEDIINSIKTILPFEEV